MSGDKNIRWGWLKFMYLYTIVGAGGFGLGMIFVPDVIRSLFGFPRQDPIIFGIAGSVFAGFGLISIMGLMSPLKFAPVLLLQLCYKLIWLVGVIMPLLVSGRFLMYATAVLMIFATYIVGDLIAIPFSYIFSNGSDL